MVSRGDNSIILVRCRRWDGPAAIFTDRRGERGGGNDRRRPDGAQGGVATVRMNRPERLNAYNPEMGEALLSAVSEASADPSVRCVVLTGTGKAFSAGGDVESFAAFEKMGTGKFMGLAIGLHALIATLRQAPKPVVAAVNGVAAGRRVLDGAGVRRRRGRLVRPLHARVPEHRALPRRGDDLLPRARGGDPAGDGDDALFEGPLRGAGRRVGAGPQEIFPDAEFAAGRRCAGGPARRGADAGLLARRRSCTTGRFPNRWRRSSRRSGRTSPAPR